MLNLFSSKFGQRQERKKKGKESSRNNINLEDIRGCEIICVVDVQGNFVQAYSFSVIGESH